MIKKEHKEIFSLIKKAINKSSIIDQQVIKSKGKYGYEVIEWLLKKEFIEERGHFYIKGKNYNNRKWLFFILHPINFRLLAFIITVSLSIMGIYLSNNFNIKQDIKTKRIQHQIEDSLQHRNDSIINYFQNSSTNSLESSIDSIK